MKNLLASVSVRSMARSCKTMLARGVRLAWRCRHPRSDRVKALPLIDTAEWVNESVMPDKRALFALLGLGVGLSVADRAFAQTPAVPLGSSGNGSGGGGGSSGIVSFSQFGGVGDGVTDNSAAWNTFNAWARLQTTGVCLYIAPGTYNFNGGLCYGFLLGIPQLAIFGYGVTLQNTYNGTANFGYSEPISPAAQPSLLIGSNPNIALIATTAVGQQSVTCLTPAQAGNFTVGGSAMIASLDIQYYGGPPNLDQFDFVTVTAVNASTGVVSFSNDYLRHIHRSDFADGPNPNPCGKARIYPLDSGTNPWNVQHIYYGLTINQAPQAASQQYSTFTGRNVALVDCTLGGISPSCIGNFSATRCFFNSPLGSEPDKLIDVCELTDCRAIGIVNFQSSSVNVVKLRGCNFVNFGAGTAKNVIVDTCDILAFGDGQNYGLPRNCTIISSTIASYATPPSLAYVANQGLTIDGTNVSYANGVFTITNASGLMTEGWNVVPGQQIYLNGSGGATNPGFSGDRGAGTVISVQDSGSSVAITTTFAYATLASGTPSWFSGSVYINRRGTVRVYNSTGCDTVRQLSETTAFGYLPGQYYRYVYMGAGSQLTNLHGAGEIFEIDVNVIQTSSFAGTFEVACPSAPTYPGFINPYSFTMFFDLTIVGKRTYTLAGLTNKQSTDTITLNGVAQNSLPAVWSTGLEGFFNFNPTSYQPYQLPVIELVIKFSTGSFARLIPAYNDNASAVIAAVSGMLP